MHLLMVKFTQAGTYLEPSNYEHTTVSDQALDCYRTVCKENRRLEGDGGAAQGTVTKP